MGGVVGSRGEIGLGAGGVFVGLGGVCGEVGPLRDFIRKEFVSFPIKEREKLQESIRKSAGLKPSR